MDFIKNLAGGNKNAENPQAAGQSTQSTQGTQSSGGFMDKMNTMVGGGRASEKNEDVLDKGVDMFQEKVLKQGPQDNESAFEQQKDEAISDTIRGQWKNATGKDFPVADKNPQVGKF
jgi:hypothetical protein